MTERGERARYTEHMLHFLKCLETRLHNRPIKHKVSHLKQINTVERERRKEKLCPGDKKDFTSLSAAIHKTCKIPYCGCCILIDFSHLRQPTEKNTTSEQNICNPVILAFYLIQSFRLEETEKRVRWSNHLSASPENTEYLSTNGHPYNTPGCRGSQKELQCT